MKDKIKKIISFLTLLIMLIFAIQGLTYLLVPMSRADFFIHDMERMMKKGQNIDMIIIGNSHFLYGFNPQIFEQELELDNVYNASVAGLQTSSKYYITESMIKGFDPKIILFDIDWTSLYDLQGNSVTQSKLLGLDRLTGFNKMRHIVNDFRDSERIYALLQLYRYRDRIFWDDYISGNIKTKQWAESTHYQEDYYHTIKGYDKGLNCSAKPFPINEKGTFDRTENSDKIKAYIDNIAELCKSRNIHLYLVVTPVTTMQLLNIGNYQDFIDYFTAYAEEKGVYFFDMNLLKQKDTVFSDNMFYDEGHLCETGASAASMICADIIRKQLAGIDTSDMFYQSMDEMTADLSRVVAVGADVQISGDKITIKDLKYNAGKDMRVSFDVQLSGNGTDYKTIFQDKYAGDSLEFPLDEVDSKKIYVKIIGKDEAKKTEGYTEYSLDIE